MTDKAEYQRSIEGTNAKARYKLANYMAHDYRITSTRELMVLEKDGRLLGIDKKGNTFKLEPCV